MTIHATTSGRNGSSADDDIANLFTDDDAASIAGDTSGGNGDTPFSQPTPEGAAKKVSEVLGEGDPNSEHPMCAPSSRRLGEQRDPAPGSTRACPVLTTKTWPPRRSGPSAARISRVRQKEPMTPILLKQFRLFYAKERPIGVVFWAHAIPEVADRLASGTTKLRPQDWNGKKQVGVAAAETQVWIVEVIAPFGGAEEMVKDLKANVFADKPLRYVVTTPEGKKVEVM